MGHHSANLHVRGASREDVARALRAVVRRRALVSPEAGGWVSVYDEVMDRSAAEEDRLAAQLSTVLDRPVVALRVFGSSVLTCTVYERGACIDRYDSCPDYFGLLTDDQRAARKGRPEVLAHVSTVAALPNELALLLRQDAPDSRGAESVVDEDRAQALAEKLGIVPGRAIVGFEAFEDREQVQAAIGSTKGFRSIRAKTSHDETALFEAISGGDVAAATALLDRGVSVDSIDKRGIPALYRAVEQGHLAIVRVLLARGVARADVQGALSWAVLRGQLPIIRELVGAGADIHAIDEHGRTALYVAVCHPRASVECIGWLLAAGARVNARMDRKHMLGVDRGTSALHAAAEFGRADVVALLLDAGAEVDAQDARGETPIARAQLFRHADVVRLLEQAGAATT